jgi:hypothetical protein
MSNGKNIRAARAAIHSSLRAELIGISFGLILASARRARSCRAAAQVLWIQAGSREAWRYPQSHVLLREASHEGEWRESWHILR